MRALAAPRWPTYEPARRAWLFRILRNAFIDSVAAAVSRSGFDPAADNHRDDVDAGWWSIAA